MTFDTQTKSLNDLNTWANNRDNEGLLGAHAETVQKKIRIANFKSNQVSSSRGAKPTVGIYGPSQAGKSYLTAKFAENTDGLLSVQLDQEYDFLRQINPAGGKESTALVSRFTTDQTVKFEKFPLKARLLSEVDLVCILSNSYYCDNADAVYPDDEKILDILARFKSIVFNNNAAYLNGDGQQIEQYLEQKVLPKEVREKFSKAWPVIEQIHLLPDLTKRCEIYSIFWNFNNNFSDLFLNLANVLQRLGSVEEVYLPVEALFPRETSIIDVSVLNRLNTSEDDQTLIVLAGSEEVTVRKSVLSALISELFLTITRPSRSVFDMADLLDFPGARTRFEKTLNDTNTVNTHEFFLRGKIDYLFHKFSMSYAIDALVICVDPGPLNIRELPKALDDWLQLNEINSSPDGSKLFLALTKFDTHFPKAVGSDDDEVQRFQNAIESGLLQPFAQSESSWPKNWSGDNFKNTFPIRNPNYPLEGYFKYINGVEVEVSSEKLSRIKELECGFLKASLVKDHVGDAKNKWNDLVAVNNGGVNYLVRQIETLNLVELKNKNLDHQMAMISETLHDGLSIFVHSDDSQIKLKKEIAKFNELYQGIVKIYEARKLPALLKNLSISEDIVISVLNKDLKIDENEDMATPSAEPEPQPQRPSILQTGNNVISSQTYGANPLPNKFNKLADSILSSWVNSVTLGYDQTKVMNVLSTDLASFEFIVNHIAHEAQISKLRAVLVRKFSDWSFGLTLDANSRAIAKLASEEINNHLCLRDRESDLKTVENRPIYQFDNLGQNSPLKEWNDWMEGFGKILKSNCEAGTLGLVNFEQNDILIAALKGLKCNKGSLVP